MENCMGFNDSVSTLGWAASRSLCFPIFDIGHNLEGTAVSVASKINDATEN
jgi:hypothetical protein